MILQFILKTPHAPLPITTVGRVVCVYVCARIVTLPPPHTHRVSTDVGTYECFTLPTTSNQEACL